MSARKQWFPVGGCEQNPGTWDDGAGAIIYVAQHLDGTVRRIRNSYCGRGGNWVAYWPAGSSTGCWAENGDGPGFRSLAAARRAARQTARG